jgi:Tol biopolymer transport system component
MVEGGFDPVPVPAAAGDTLDVRIDLAGEGGALAFMALVPMRRPPVVVRTDPPPRKRDVPLNAVLLVLFSEPIDPATLTDASVQLMLEGAPVAGMLEVRDGAHLAATFTPAEPLVAGAEYTLVVTQGIKDLDGDALEASASVTFTTAILAAIRVTAATTGPDPDGDGYSVTVDSSATPVAQLEPNDSITLTGVPPGNHEVHLVGVNTNCAVVGPNPLTVAVAFGDTATAAFAVTCAPVTQLAFVRDGQIYRVYSNGTGLVRLTDGPADGDPAWSPDGRRIAFTRTRGDTSGIYVMDADGSNVVRRTTAADPEAPTWSPDGTRIAFAALGGGSMNVYATAADDNGTGATAVVDWPGYDVQPAWSPDGGKIAFVSDWRAYDFLYDLYVVNPDGSDGNVLVAGPFSWNDGLTFYFQPAWSPDGSKIATVVCTYAWDNCFPNSTVALVNADGSGLVSLAATGGFAHPSWSPDGRTIAFSASACRGCSASIYYVRADGSARGMIIANGHSPAWRP